VTSADLAQPWVARPGAALFLDAAGTLLHLAEPVAAVYARVARAWGGRGDEAEIARRFGAAMAAAAPLRAGDPRWHAFWRRVVREATGLECEADDGAYRELYDHFARADAWRVAAGAERCCRAVRERGAAVAVISNWDVRLRPLLEQLGVTAWIDVAIVSGEVDVEKPDPRIFAIACERAGVRAADAVHVGDSARTDVAGAVAAGCRGWLMGEDVADFAALQARLLGGL
jgi:REG-2-like HAD superfamily hydrolase